MKRHSQSCVAADAFLKQRVFVLKKKDATAIFGGVHDLEEGHRRVAADPGGAHARVRFAQSRRA
eukprot:5986252-Lingulodinium_polyedra.AAC.1